MEIGNLPEKEFRILVRRIYSSGLEWYIIMFNILFSKSHKIRVQHSVYASKGS